MTGSSILLSVLTSLTLTFSGIPPSVFVKKDILNYSQKINMGKIVLEVKNESFPHYTNIFFQTKKCKVSKRIEALSNKILYESSSQKEYLENVIEFVKKEIVYDKEADEKTADEVLKDKRADCRGKANLAYKLFCRFGIKAKKITGYILNKDKSIIQKHRWLEVYFPKKGWFLVDPSAKRIYPIYIYTKESIELKELKIEINYTKEIGNI